MKILIFDTTNSKADIDTAMETVSTYAPIPIQWGVIQYPPTEVEFQGKPVKGSYHVNKTWFRDTFTTHAKGFDFVIVYFSAKNWLKNQRRNRSQAESIEQNWGVSEIAMRGSFKKKVKIAPKVKVNDFAMKVLHEMCHGMFDHKLHVKDVTHELHYEKKNLLEAVKLWKESRPLNALLPAVQRKADEFTYQCAVQGVPIRITEGFRSFERQDALYAQGRTTPGQIVTNARAGESFHNYGIAFDIVPLVGYNGNWTKIAGIGEKLGLSWGGRWTGFVDKPHFEYTLGYTLSQFQNGQVDLSRFS